MKKTEYKLPLREAKDKKILRAYNKVIASGVPKENWVSETARAIMYSHTGVYHALKRLGVYENSKKQ